MALVHVVSYCGLPPATQSWDAAGLRCANHVVKSSQSITTRALVTTGISALAFSLNALSLSMHNPHMCYHPCLCYLPSVCPLALLPFCGLDIAASTLGGCFVPDIHSACYLTCASGCFCFAGAGLATL